MGNKFGLKKGKEIDSKKFKEIFEKYESKKTNQITKETALKILQTIAKEIDLEYNQNEAEELLKEIDQENKGLDFKNFKTFFFESKEKGILSGNISLSQSMMSSSLTIKKDTLNENIENNTNVQEDPQEEPSIEEKPAIKIKKPVKTNNKTGIITESNEDVVINDLKPYDPEKCVSYEYEREWGDREEPYYGRSKIGSKSIGEHNFSISKEEEGQKVSTLPRNPENQANEKVDSVEVIKSNVDVLESEKVVQLFSRVKEIETKKEDVKDFQMREKSIKAPKTGNRIQIAFPPVDEPELEILVVTEKEGIVIEGKEKGESVGVEGEDKQDKKKSKEGTQKTKKTEQNKVEPPNIEEPNVDPKIEEPKIETIVIEQNKVEPLKIEEPKVEPKIEIPKEETFGIEQNKVETPKVEPKVEPPKIKVEQPKIEIDTETKKPPKRPNQPEPTKEKIEIKRVVQELEIERYSPTGDFEEITAVSITFNQPMIAISTISQIDKMDIPAILNPPIPGIWRWNGTLNLQFSPTHKFPKSTEYTVFIKKGTQSHSGGELKKDFSFSFTTKTLSITNSYPYSGMQMPNLNPSICLVFNQKINQKDVFEKVSIKDNNAINNGREIILLNREEATKDSSINSLYNSNSENCLAFKFTESLLPSTTYNLSVAKGAPSAEGPRLTNDALSLSFKTYNAFTMSYCNPNTDHRKAPPNTTWYIYFSNGLDQKTVAKDSILIEPPCEGLSFYSYSNYVQISNKSKLKTNYTVTIMNSLKDIYGQSLSGKNKCTFKVRGRIPNAFINSTNGMQIHDANTSAPMYKAIVYEFQKVLVRVYQVEPKDYHGSLLNNRGDYLREGKNPHNVGKIVFDKEIHHKVIDPYVPYSIEINLQKLLQNPKKNSGQLLVTIEPERTEYTRLKKGKNWNQRQLVTYWLQSTYLSIDLFSSGVKTNYIWITDLLNGAPVPKCSVWLEDKKMTTNSGGICELESKNVNSGMVIAKKDDDVSFIPGIYCQVNSLSSISWYVFNDRGLYRPKEKVTIKGYLRNIVRDKEGGLLPSYSEGTISYIVYDPRGEKLCEGKCTLNKFSSFHFDFTLKDNVNLGQGNIYIKHDQTYNSHYHYFKIEEFRRPEFEVIAFTLPPLTNVCSPKDKISFETIVKASYFAGGPLADAKVFWEVLARVCGFKPAGLSDYEFEENNLCWWISKGSYATFGNWDFEGVTDQQGEHKLRLNCKGNQKEPTPININLVGNVRDINNQTITGATSILLHPSSLYVGFKVNQFFCRHQDKVPISICVASIDGTFVSTKVKIEISRSYQEKKEDKRGMSYFESKSDIFKEQITSSSDSKSAAIYNFEPKGKYGNYVFTFIVEDKEGRKNKSKMNFTVSGGQSESSKPKSKTKIDLDKIELFPNKSMYHIGEVAEVLVSSPFSPCHGCLVVDCDGILDFYNFEMSEGSEVVKFNIKKEIIPNAILKAYVNGYKIEPSDDKKNSTVKVPAYAFGEIEINVSNKIHSLTVTPTPSEKDVIPGEEMSVEVLVKDNGGKPVKGAEVCIVVVDESVLSLSGHQLTNPLSLFYTKRYGKIQTYRQRSNITFITMEDLSKKLPPRPSESDYFSEEEEDKCEEECMKEMNEERHCCGDLCNCCECECDECCLIESIKEKKCCRKESSKKKQDKQEINDEKEEHCDDEDAGGDDPIKVRSNFDPLGHFSPSAVTDCDGLTSVKFNIPDSLTKYRIWAMAATNSQYGLGESNVTVTLPLMVRPSLPRFLNFGDNAEVNIVVQNLTNQKLDIKVAMRCTNAFIKEGTGGYKIELQPQKRINVTFPVSTKFVGMARFQTVVSSGKFSDCSENEIPIYTPATSEAFATYGDFEESTALFQDVKAPENVFEQFGGLEVSTSTTALQSLTDAFLYLYNYAFECNEQLSSGIIACASLRDVITSFKIKGIPTVDEINTYLTTKALKIKNRQNSSGGFGSWEASSYTDPFISCYIGFCLAVCKQKNIPFDSSVWLKLKPFLERIENHLCVWYSKMTKNSLKAFSLFVLTKFGENVTDKAIDLFKKNEFHEFSLESLGWLVVSLQGSSQSEEYTKKILNYLYSNIHETAETANFVTSYGDDGKYVMFHSDRRTDGVLLDALLTVSPKNSLCPKIAKGLLAHKKRGRWANTQENSLILYALDKYFSVYESQVPDFIMRMWYGEDYAGEQVWKGRSTDTNIVNIGMKYVMEKDKTLIIQKEGKGRLYYRLALNYSPTNLISDEMDRGFIVKRSYEAVDENSHLKKDNDGVWRMKVGEKFRVKIDLTTKSRRYHVAMVDKIPAGLEIINPKLKGQLSVSNRSNNPYSSRYYNQYQWYEHVNFRDERAEAFQSLLWEGNYSFLLSVGLPPKETLLFLLLIARKCILLRFLVEVNLIE
eukprot:TRINITY_DN1498_c0_g1_i3.p1 TRINITY_DN1498_c0_g1~~TRINITY_DN1498_c0_g1_i3.p1  ORF type:complete len:2381 (-),score=691.25 TRINITY_DN1498_c0_g1_i3:21-7163(-)